MKGFATFFTSRGKKEKDASLSASGASSPSPNNNNNNKTKVPAIKVNDAFLAPSQRDLRAPSPSPTTTGSSLSSAFSRLHRPSLASLRKHVSSDAHSTSSHNHHHHHSPSSSSSHSHLQPHHQHQSSISSSATTTSSSSRLALSRSFFRSVSDVSKSFTASSTPTSASSSTTSTPATETCTLPSATSSTSTVHLTVGRKPSNASLINDMIDGSALNENGKARHEALPRAPTPSQLDRLLLVPQTSSAALVPPLQSSHPESSNGIPSPSNTTPTAAGNITSNIFDAYDPFAAHYTPPLNSRKRLSPPTSVPAPTTTAANGVSAAPDSPPRLLPQLPKVGNTSSSSGAAKQQQQLLPVIQPKSAARPRALSLGSTAHHHHGLPPACPAHVLGPLPPLPPFAQGLITKGSALAGVRIDGKDADADPPNSAPAHAVTFSKRDRSGSVASSGTTKSSTSSSVGGSRPLGSSSKRPMTSPRPSSSEKIWANHVPASVSLGNSISEGAAAPAPASSWLDATPVRAGKRVPQLDQTWAQFLSETQSDFAKMIIVPSHSTLSSGTGSASTITAGSASSTRTMMMTRVGGGNGGSSGGRLEHVGQPRGPPPNRPLPPAPVPIQPLNIRRRARAQTVGTTSPMVSPAAAAESIPATVSQPMVGLGVVGVLPISPPPTAGPKLDFDSSILDVVVTPATEYGDITMTMMISTEDDSKTASRPTTPATISSLPYLRGSESTNMLSLHAGRHSRNSSLSGSEWDGCSRTVSEMSLSLFPAPPPARAAPAPTEPPANTSSSSSLLPPPSSLSSVLELPTPPVTPTNLRFVPANAGLYSASRASRSTSTIRPPSKPEEEEGGGGVADRDSCVLPLEDRSHLHHNTPATRPPSPPSIRYSADSTRSDPDFVSSATTVSSHEMDTSVEDSLYRTSLDTDQTSEMMMHIVDSPPRSTRSSTHRKAVTASPSKARMLWCPPSPPQADRHSTQGKDKFNLLPNFYFDATFAAGDAAAANAGATLPGQPPSTPIKHRKSGVARREQLLNLLSANETAAQLRSPGSPWGGRVEWGEAL